MPVSREGDPERMGKIPKKAQSATNRYDSALQMFCDAPREPDMSTLTFLRWLVERGRLEHAASGPASGEFTINATRTSFLARSENGSPARLPLGVDTRRTF